MNPSHQKASSGECVRRDVEIHGRLISLVELPALSRLSEEEVMRQTLHCVSLCDPGVHAFLLIVPVGLLTDEDRAEIEKIQRIFYSKEHLIMLFTTELTAVGFALDFVKSNPESQRLISRCGGQYRVMGLKEPEDPRQIPDLLDYIEKMKTQPYSLQMYVKAQENRVRRETEERLRKMEDKIKELEQKIQLNLADAETLKPNPQMRIIAENDDPVTPVSSLSSRWIVLLGKTGVGKSAAGNTILGQKEFRSEMRMRSVTSVCSEAHATVSGRSVSVVDTPGLFHTDMNPEELMTEIAFNTLNNSVYLSSSGLHAFLIVFSVNDRFTEQEQQIPEMIEMMFGQEVLKYSMILLTHGDQLEGKTVEEIIERNSILRDLVDQCGGRFHVFNNKAQNNREQVNDLLQKIDSMIEQNGGGHYTNQI